MNHLILLIISFFFVLGIANILPIDYFERLQIHKDASDREIRLAFKRLALQYHPYKNQGDPKAQTKMIEINEAMTNLLDPERRSVYEKGGVKALKKFHVEHHHAHHTYEHYEDFGSYDDEPCVEVMDYHSWEASHSSLDSWFVYFHSGNCPKCKQMQSTWKNVAHRLQNIVHVAVLNCGISFSVCRQLKIRNVPEFLFYKKGLQRGYQDPIKYKEIMHGVKDFVDFALGYLPDTTKPLLADDFMSDSLLPVSDQLGDLWIIGFCGNETDCSLLSTKMKEIEVIVDEMVPCGRVNCEAFADLCEKQDVKMFPNTIDEQDIEVDPSSDIEEEDDVFPPATIIIYFGEDQVRFTRETSSQEIAFTALKQLPSLPVMDAKLLESMLRNAMSKDSHVNMTKLPEERNEYLILFASQEKCEPDTVRGPGTAFCYKDFLSFRKVRSLLHDDWEFQDLVVTTFSCHHDDHVDETHRHLCEYLKLTSKPKILHIVEDGLNPHRFHDRIDRNDQVLGFVQEVYRSSVHELLHDDFEQHVNQEKQTWFINFYAPWCHHCREVWPEWNLASRHFDLPKNHPIHFGKIDCSLHQELCQEHHVRGYPTFLLYIDGMRHQYDFDHRTAEEFVRFIKQNLEPVVHEFDIPMYKKEIYDPDSSVASTLDKDESDIWIINFFAPWCSHCHIMSPKFREAAISLRGAIKFGKFNCELDEEFCLNAGVRSFPTIWKFDTKEDCSKPIAEYTGQPDPQIILNFAMKDVSNYVELLDSKKFKSLRINIKDEDDVDDAIAWIVFFSGKEIECDTCELVDLRLRALAARYHEKEEIQRKKELTDPVATYIPVTLRFGKIDCRSTGATMTFCLSQKVKRFPVLLYYSSVTGKPVRFNTIDILEIISLIDRNMDHDRRETASPFKRNPHSWRYRHREL